jgi:hypothetical protein
MFGSYDRESLMRSLLSLLLSSGRCLRGASGVKPIRRIQQLPSSTVASTWTWSTNMASPRSSLQAPLRFLEGAVAPPDLPSLPQCSLRCTSTSRRGARSSTARPSRDYGLLRVGASVAFSSA